MLHTGIRVYAYTCTYSSSSWLDSPTTLISALQTALSSFTYKRLLVSNVRNASRKNIEIEIDGITYTSKTSLNASENDALITDITTALSGVSNLTFSDINCVNDRFLDDPTTGWPGQSKGHEG